MTTEQPQTAAGRALLDIIGGMDPQGLYPPDPADLIALIEAEARATLPPARGSTAACSRDAECWLVDGHPGPHSHIVDGKAVDQPATLPPAVIEALRAAEEYVAVPQGADDCGEYDRLHAALDALRREMPEVLG